MRSVPQGEVADRPFLWTRGVAASETLRYLDKNGVDVEAILSKAQLSRSQLSQDSGGISVASQHRFLEFAAAETNDSLLGADLDAGPCAAGHRDADRVAAAAPRSAQ
jgi:hypothetical protein